MDLNQYQELARSTAIYPTEHRIVYPALGLAGEAGEVAEKIKKMLRDGTPEEDVQVALAKELLTWRQTWDFPCLILRKSMCKS